MSYSPILSHTAPTSTPKSIYAANLFNTSTGSYNLATGGEYLTLTTPAIYQLDGSNGYWFLEGSVLNAFRPSTASYTGTTPTNPTYAYDTTSSSLDSSTYSTLTTAINTASIQTYVFSNSTYFSGTLYVYIQNIATADNTSSDTINEAISSVSIIVSLDGGTTWLNTANSFSQGSLWTAGSGVSNYTLSRSLTNQLISDIRVKITCNSQRLGSGASLAIASVTCGIYDIACL